MATPCRRALAPGCRLVSKEGDLWRWDGFTARADAPKPAAVRLEQKTRLAEVESEIEALTPKAYSRAARRALAEAAAKLAAIEEALRAARRETPAAEQLGAGRTHGAGALRPRGRARKEAHAASLDDVIGRFAAELAEHEQALATAEAAASAEADGEEPGRAAGRGARRRRSGPRGRAAAARAALDVEIRDRDGRARRLELLTGDREDWARSAASPPPSHGWKAWPPPGPAPDAELAKARAAPEDTFETRRAALLDELGVAEARRGQVLRCARRRRA